jgi:DNA-binding Xre family transcriptional regulator
MGLDMLKYKIDVISRLKDKGYSTYFIRKNKIMTEGQLQQIRDNKLLSHTAFDGLCKLLDCQPGDLLEYVPDEEEK